MTSAKDVAHLNVRGQGPTVLDGAAEKQVVAEIIAGLEQMGYRKPSGWFAGCKGAYLRVGQRKAKGSGTEVGCPDLWVCPLTTKVWYAFEIKARTKKAVVSKEQNTLQKLGIVRVVNSAHEVFAILQLDGGR